MIPFFGSTAIVSGNLNYATNLVLPAQPFSSQLNYATARYNSWTVLENLNVHGYTGSDTNGTYVCIFTCHTVTWGEEYYGPLEKLKRKWSTNDPFVLVIDKEPYELPRQFCVPNWLY
jgi:hypothetical protein